MFRFELLSKLLTSDDQPKKITAAFTKIDTNKIQLTEGGTTFFANPMENAKITFMKGKESRGQKEIGAEKTLKAVRLPADGETVTIDCDASKVQEYVYGYTAKFTDIEEDAIIAIVYKDLNDGKFDKVKTAIVYNPTDKNLVIASQDKVTSINVEVQDVPEKQDITSQTVKLPTGKYAILTAELETKFTVTIEASSEEPEELGKKALTDEEASLAKYETIVYKYSAIAPTTFSYTFMETQKEKTLSRFDLYPMTATIKKHTSNVIDLPSSSGEDAFVAFELEAPKFDYKKSEEESKNQVNNIEGKLTFVRIGADETLKITATEQTTEGGSAEQEGAEKLPDGEDTTLPKERKTLETPTHTYGYYLSLKDFDQKANVLLVREVGDIDFKQDEPIVLCNAFGKAIKLTAEQKFEVIKAANVKEEIASGTVIDSLDDNGFVILTLKDSETAKLKVEDPSAGAGLKALAQEDESPAKKSTNVLVKYDITAPASFIYTIAGKDTELTADDAFPKEESGSGPVDPEHPEGGVDPEHPEGGVDPEHPEGGVDPEHPEGGVDPEHPEGGVDPEHPEEGNKETESESETEGKEENKPEKEPQPEDSNQNSDDSGNSVNVGAIVGGVIGGVAFIAIVAGLVYFFVIRKKHQKVDKESDAPKP